MVERCNSTNTMLLEEKGSGCVLLVAEEQTAGRGRRGRRWHSTPGAGLTFSLALRVKRPARELAGLSLAAGVALCKALRALGVARAALKWPNDLVVDGAKLGGILVETRGAGAATRAVIGIGINCRRDSGLVFRVRRKVASLDQYIDVKDRNDLIKKIVPALLDSLATFEAQGLEALRGEWEALDAHAGQRLRVRLSDGRALSGISDGIAEDGALRLTTRNGIKKIRSGRVVSARVA